MNWLKQEYPKYILVLKPWKNALFTFGVVLLFLLIFQPFGFREKEFLLKLYLFPGYALLGFVFSVIHYYLVKKKLASGRLWRVQDEIVSLFLGIILLNLFVHLLTVAITGDMPFNLYWYFKLFYHVLSLFVLIRVVEFFYFFTRSYHQKSTQLAKQNLAIEQQLKEENRKNQQDKIAFTLESDAIEINPERIVLIQSLGNYLVFHLIDEAAKIKKLVKRGRMHQVEKDVEGFDEFYRCHRAFIVNLNFADKLFGTTKSARLHFDCAVFDIPVSRNRFKELKLKLDALVCS